MFRVLLLAISVTLAGCATSTFAPSASFDERDPKGLVILGMVEQGTPGGVVIGRFDSETRKITGVTNFGGNMGLHVGGNGIILPTAFGPPARFHAFQIPAGEYAVIQVGSAVQRTLSQTTVQTTRLVDFDTWTVRDITPVFSVVAGEAVYIGDMQIDYRSFPARVGIAANTPAMTDFMSGFPNVRVTDVKLRPLRSFRN